MTTEISNLLQVYNDGYIQVPSCEPPSGLSSPKFAALYSIGPCKSSYVRLRDALSAIPGSEIVYGYNFGPHGVRQKWLKLPPRDVDCPCVGYEDWYKVLSSLEPYQGEPEPEICDFQCDNWHDTSYETPSSPNTYFDNKTLPSLNATLPLIPPYYRGDSNDI
jgi:hypothetical protein